jgi:GH24 family phage-related lysozyme (muramidase)
LGGSQITCLQSSHKVPSFKGLISEAWNIGCTSILDASSNLYTSLNTHSTKGNELENLDMTFGARS